MTTLCGWPKRNTLLSDAEVVTMDQSSSWWAETPGMGSSDTPCPTLPLQSMAPQPFINSDVSLHPHVSKGRYMAPDTAENTLAVTVLNLNLCNSLPTGSPAENLSSETISSQDNVAGTVSQQRRSHNKSRRGCYNCKRRRIKVDLMQWDKM